MAKLALEEAESIFGVSDKVAEETKGGGGNFIKLADGESVVLVFQKRAPLSYKEVWDPAANRSEIYDPDKHDGMRPRGKFMFSVARVEADGLHAAVLECGAELYHDIKQELMKREFSAAFELTRKGEAKETKYRFTFEEQLSDEQMEAVSAVEWLSLEEVFGAKSGDKPAAAAPKKANPWGKK